MPLVAAKCTECGGTAKVDVDKKAAVCEYCGNAFVVEEAINNFNTNYINNTNISNSVVHIHQDNNKDFVIKAGALIEYKGVGRRVEIPDSVVEIGKQAFYELNITDVVIPNNVVKIGKYAFFGCTKLTNITIPKSVVKIDSGAFMNCFQLSTVNMSSQLLDTLDVDTMRAIFDETPYYEAYLQDLVNLRIYRRNKGICIFCGGELSFFGKKCKSCGQKN